MSLVQGRGGVPRVRLETVDTTGRKYTFPFVLSHLQIQTDGDLRLYFTEEDFTNDTNYVTLSAVTAPPWSSWEGPAELQHVYLRAVTASRAVTMIAYQRRA